MEKRSRRNISRYLWVGGLLLLLGAVAFFVSRRANRLANAEPVESGDIVTVFSGDLSSNTSASGKIIPRRQAQLSLTTAGIVETVFVEAGDAVESGDPIIQLETDALERVVATAEQNVAIQEANLAELVANVADYDIASANAAVESAQANLDGLLDGPGEEQIAAQQASLRAAQAVVAGNSAQLNQASAPADQTDITSAEANLRSAQAAVNAAQQNLQAIQNGASQADIATAEANLRSAQASVNAAWQNLQSVKEGPSEADLATARANLLTAQQQKQSAQDFYDDVFTCYLQDDGYNYCPKEALQDQATQQLDVANQNLQAAQARMRDLENSPSPEAVAQAEANLASATTQRDNAQTQLDNLKAGNTSEAIAQAQANLASAIAQRDNAQASLDKLKAGADSNSVASAQANLNSAAANRDAAQANLDLLLAGNSDAQIASARAQLAQAEAALANLLAGASDERIAITSAQLEQAKINLAEAEANLEKATLRAPFAGIITAIHLTEGEFTSGLAAEIADMDDLLVSLDVDEIDLHNLQLGEEAIISLDAYPDEEFAGTVTFIAPIAQNNTSEIVSYEVQLTLNETDIPIYIGMTANAELETARRDDVLLIPNNAIKADRQRGTFSVNLITDDNLETFAFEEVEITIGLRDSQFTEILSGLQDGDQVLVGDTAPRVRFEGPFGEGGGE